jgi:transcriptional regulator with XRE-family HTH domain
VKINIKIRNFRKKAGITQTALAEAVGVNQSMIAHYESGFKMPSVAVLARIAKELKVKIDDLI